MHIAQILDFFYVTKYYCNSNIICFPIHEKYLNKQNINWMGEGQDSAGQVELLPENDTITIQHHQWPL